MINASTTVILPNRPGLTQLGDIDSIEIQADGSAIIGARGVILAAPRNQGRPLIALWDDAGRLLAIGYGLDQGIPLTQEHADLVVAAIAEGRIAMLDEVDALVLAGQHAAMPMAGAMTTAPLTKLRDGDKAGYMRQWHTRTGNVKTEYDEIEMLRQVTGFDWQGQVADLSENGDIARDAVRRTLGEDALGRMAISDEDADVYDENCDPTHYVLVHRSGIVAVIDARDEETIAFAILVPGMEGPVVRTVDVRPTIEPKIRAKKTA
jgi:hypothetical protein